MVESVDGPDRPHLFVIFIQSDPMRAESFTRCRCCGAVNDSQAQHCDLCLSGDMQHTCDACGAPLRNPLHPDCHRCNAPYVAPHAASRPSALKHPLAHSTEQPTR